MYKKDHVFMTLPLSMDRGTREEKQKKRAKKPTNKLIFLGIMYPRYSLLIPLDV